MSDDRPDPSSWSPDPQTIRWAVGTMHEDRIVDSLRAEIEDRQEGLAMGSREWWLLVASIAIEHASFDLSKRAAEWQQRSG